MTAQEILKMIESCDQSNTEKLDEIDFKTHCWIHGYSESEWFNNPVKLYTRSRDALKAIRPGGVEAAYNQPRYRTEMELRHGQMG